MDTAFQLDPSTCLCIADCKARYGRNGREHAATNWFFTEVVEIHFVTVKTNRDMSLICFFISKRLDH